MAEESSGRALNRIFQYRVECLRRDAGDDLEKLKIAGFILVSRDLCWEDFLELDDPLKDWALGVLRQWAQDDPYAPELLFPGGNRKDEL